MRVLVFLAWSTTAGASVCEELVREGAVHESAREDDVAVRRYTEAITLDGTCGNAYVGLANLRLRQGDGREAERVSTMALTRIPTLGIAHVLLARSKWTQGRREEAENDLAFYASSASFEEARPALKELATWYGAEGKAPAQLGAWRLAYALAERQNDPAAQKEARTMVKALMILVAEADPVNRNDNAVRRAIATAAKR